MKLTPQRRRWSMLLAALPLSLPLLAGSALAVESGASATGPTGLAPITHPDADHMGSTIRAHEGGSSGGPVSAPMLQASSTTGQPMGMDVSSFQANVDWTTAASNGGTFAYVKATESTGYVNPYFGQQYNGSANAGLIRGAYHFALPDRSSGATQAQYFVAHGGGWSADGRTLPPMLDIEYNPYGASTCYGLSTVAMSAWIRDFSDTVHTLTARYPTIYTTRDWWNTCTGSDPTFAADNPLFIARYASTVGLMPAGWGFQSIWQYSDRGILPGDQDVFNGTLTQLQTFARGSETPTPTPVVTPPPTPAPVTSAPVEAPTPPTTTTSTVPVVPAVSIAGATTRATKYGATVSVSGTANPGATVGVWFQRANAGAYTQRRTLTASSTGAWNTTYIANDDYRVYATNGAARTPTQAILVAPTIAGAATHVVPLNSTYVITGTGIPGATLSIHFHKAGTAATDYSIVRPVTVGTNGNWSRPYLASVDYRFYASLPNGQTSPTILVQAR